jgi:hypothetical protein
MERQENQKRNSADRQTTRWMSNDLHGRSHLRGHVPLPSTTVNKPNKRIITIHARLTTPPTYPLPVTKDAYLEVSFSWTARALSFLSDIDFHEPQNLSFWVMVFRYPMPDRDRCTGPYRWVLWLERCRCEGGVCGRPVMSRETTLRNFVTCISITIELLILCLSA